MSIIKNIKNIILITVLFLFMIFPQVFYGDESQKFNNYDSINGDRYENGFVIYEDKDFTGTNEWGYEVICDNTGKVTYLGDNNNKIPENGFVLSAHGEKALWLQENIVIGDIIIMDRENKKIIVTKDGLYNPFYTETMSFDALNEARLTDCLVVYKDSAKTGTNMYGYEVGADKDGNIIQIGGNDTVIPNSGLVLSAHGAKIDFLKKFAVLGAKVTVDYENKNVIINYDKDSYLKTIELGIASKKTEYEDSKNTFKYVLFDKIDEAFLKIDGLFTEFKKGIENDDKTIYLAKGSEINALLKDIELYNTESRPVETRGLWLRPNETNVEEVKKVVKNMADNAINTVYIETFFGNSTIIKVKEGELYEQNPIFNGFDVLQAYIDECKNYDIKVQIWATVFNAGSEENEINKGLSLHIKKPEWVQIAKNGDNFELNPYGKFYFLNPALDEVNDYLISLYSYILDTYDIDGFQLDYIRYPNIDEGKDFGYDEYTRSLFKDEYGIDPIEIDDSHELWQDWCKFRCNFVTGFVERVSKLVREKRPDILLSVDAFPDFETSPYKVMQDVKTWIENEYIDAIFPMSYGEDTVLYHSAETVKVTGDSHYAFVGTATYNRFPASLVVKQVEQVRSAGGDGVAMFEYASLIAEKYGEALLISVYRNK
ncbi:MAG: hypothetical protein K0S55_784, partial [Clostridia bacterium]|nr:hypothetical protein [Clostridia bacterium]